MACCSRPGTLGSGASPGMSLWGAWACRGERGYRARMGGRGDEGRRFDHRRERDYVGRLM
ncbi:hypothetical protein B0H19DRAFT_1203390 [Mycena capillaripes]|nr:hypothetical protein B0H19DRAFT_1203390 [Mycena capillaripes]